MIAGVTRFGFAPMKNTGKEIDMTKRVELIPKQSTLDDIRGPWVDSGREDNCRDGQFVFDEAESCAVVGGTVIIVSKGKSYFYNMADFYRVKVS